MDSDKEQKRAERAARERHERALGELREGTYRFASKLRGQAGLIVEELIDPEGDCVATLADTEGDAGALALALPLEVITFETWLFGQVGDQEELDLDHDAHWETWFNFGSWLGETLRRRHGGHWLIMAEDPKSWRLGFSKILFEIQPFMFAEQLLRIGQGAARVMVGEIERLRRRHDEQKEKDDGQELDRFTAQHYHRMHTIPLGQFMVMDFGALEQLWSHAPAREMTRELKKQAKRLAEVNAPFVTRIVEAVEKADQNRPLSKQTGDRGLFEAIAQIVAMRRATAPIAVDVLEQYVLPTMHIGIPDKFPPLDAEDLAELRKGIELFAFYVDVVPHKHQAADSGLLGSIPPEDLRTPYGDRTDLEIAKGDWVIVDPKRFKSMLLEFDSTRMLDSYDQFVKYVRENPKAPRRRDNGRFLAETTARALADLKACVVASSKDGHALLFRMLPPPG